MYYFYLLLLSHYNISEKIFIFVFFSYSHSSHPYWHTLIFYFAAVTSKSHFASFLSFLDILHAKNFSFLMHISLIRIRIFNHLLQKDRVFCNTRSPILPKLQVPLSSKVRRAVCLYYLEGISLISIFETIIPVFTQNIITYIFFLPNTRPYLNASAAAINLL